MLKQLYSQGSLTVVWRLVGNNTHHEEMIRRMVNDPKITAYQF
jgi:putative Mg2+ transporter-C (MgtC) family protein